MAYNLDDGEEKKLFEYKPVKVDVTPDGKITWQNTDKSNVYMFENYDENLYYKLMPKVVTELLSKI